jgi:hypothetical protein
MEKRGTRRRWHGEREIPGAKNLVSSLKGNHMVGRIRSLGLIHCQNDDDAWRGGTYHLPLA